MAVLRARQAFPRFFDPENGPLFSLGDPGCDRILGGGLCLQALHEAVPAGPSHKGAALGFALALAARTQAKGDVLFVQQDFAALEAGALHGAGGEIFGIASSRLLLVRAAKPIDVLWTMEEGMRAGSFAAVIGELAEDRDADLTATRRLALSAQAGRTFGVLLRPRASLQPSAAATRWEISSRAGTGDRFGGLGRIAFTLTLTKNKRGACGAWDVEWDRHERIFKPAVSVPVAAPSLGQPYRAQRSANGCG